MLVSIWLTVWPPSSMMTSYPPKALESAKILSSSFWSAWSPATKQELVKAVLWHSAVLLRCIFGSFTPCAYLKATAWLVNNYILYARPKWQSTSALGHWQYDDSSANGQAVRRVSRTKKTLCKATYQCIKYPQPELLCQPYAWWHKQHHTPGRRALRWECISSTSAIATIYHTSSSEKRHV